MGGRRAAGLASIAAILCAGLPLSASCDEVIGTAAKIMTRTFREVWASGDHETADRMAAETMSVPGLRGKPLAMEYLVFERARCDFDEGDPRIAGILEHDRAIRQGILVCKKSQQPEDGQASRRILAALREEDGWIGRERLYDRFARQPTINVSALRWLRTHDRVDTVPDGVWSNNALSSQILAGRLDNVRILLDAGYDPNQATIDPGLPEGYGSSNPIQPVRRGLLPLDAARRALAGHGLVAVQIAQVLLAAGADPYKLAWYPAKDTAPSLVIPGELMDAFNAVIESAKPGHLSTGLEFIGFRDEHSPSGKQMYARFLVGNGGNATVRIPAWTSDGLWLLDGLPAGTEVERQVPGAANWKGDLLISDGISPGTVLVLAPGASAEVLLEWWDGDVMAREPGTRYRVRLTVDKQAIHSDPFIPQLPKQAGQQEVLDKKRDWYR